MRKLWPFTFNFLLYAGFAAVSPFVVLYYQGLGFSGTQIGLLTGIAPLITFFSAPLWTGLADATRRHRLLMSLAILLGVITLFVFPLLNAFAPLLCIAVLLNIFLAPVEPFADSATMFMLADERDMYGRIRLGGTIGFGLASPVAGVLVQNYGLRWAFWGCATLFLLAFIVSQKLVYGQLKADHPARGRVRTLLTNPRWLLFLIVAFAAGAGLTAVNSYFFPYMKELGASESTMGLALTVGTITEIPILFFANRLMKRLRSYGLLMLSMVVTGLRMLLFAACGTPSLVLLIQLLNGLTFPAMWVAGVSYADENAPAGMSTTAQGLFSAVVFGFGAAVGGFICGPLLESIGGRGLYFVFGSAVLVTMAIVALIHRRLPAQGV
jgi:PPP family 3-phenylpropionic acid transporter